jgi:regulator of replication initiation timing
MSEELGRLQRENAYLKARVAQLEDDVVDLTAEATRLRQVLDTTMARRAAARPNPLSGGQ